MKKVIFILINVVFIVSSFAQQKTTEVTYVGNSGYMIEIGDKKILIDAIFKGYPGSYELPQEIQDKLTNAQGPFDDVDFIIVTHAHSDHIEPEMVTEHLKNNPKAVFISTKQLTDHVKDTSLIVIGFNPSKDSSDKKVINGISIEAFLLPHGPDSRIINNGFLVSVDGTSFFHTGDVDFDQFTFEEFLSMQLPEKKIDLSFIQHFYLTSDSTSKQFVRKGIGGKYIIPIHYHFTTPAFDSSLIRDNYPKAIIFKEELDSWHMPIKANSLPVLYGDYLGQSLPGDTPVVFARGIVSTNHLEHSAPIFSPDGKEVFWEIVRLPIAEGVPGKKIMTMKYTENGWSKPAESEEFPVFTSDGERFYLSSLPKINNDDIGNEKEEAENQFNYIDLLAQFPELKYTHGLSLANNRTIYFMSHLEGSYNDIGIYRAEFVNGEYTKPEPLPFNINKEGFLNWTPFIAPDESYLLFSSNRNDPENDAGDLYISYRSSDGFWTEPRNIGAPVNTINQERFPMISPDGKYLFFTRPTDEGHQDVFWVGSSVIKE